MDARRGQDAAVLKVSEASGGIFTATLAAGCECRDATFPPDVINWPKMPRIARPGRESELACCLSN